MREHANTECVFIHRGFHFQLSHADINGNIPTAGSTKSQKIIRMGIVKNRDKKKDTKYSFFIID